MDGQLGLSDLAPHCPCSNRETTTHLGLLDDATERESMTGKLYTTTHRDKGQTTGGRSEGKGEGGGGRCRST